MKLDEFDRAVDTEIETNPLARLKRGAANIIDTRLRLIKLTGEQVERFAGPGLKKLFDDAKAVIERGQFDLDKNFMEFDQALLERVRFERERGELRPITAENEIKDHREALAAKLYRAMELDALRALMKPGERIKSISWWTIETTAQVLRRADLPKACRPVSFRDGNQWRRQFVSDAQVEEAIANERKSNQPIRGQTVSPWVE